VNEAWDPWSHDCHAVDALCYSLKTVTNNDLSVDLPCFNEGVQEFENEWKTPKKTAWKKMKLQEESNEININRYAHLKDGDEAQVEEDKLAKVSRSSNKEGKKVDEDKSMLTNRAPQKLAMPRVKKWKKAPEHQPHPEHDAPAKKLSPIKTIELETINTVTEDGQWEEIELAVDSGATESVAPPTLPETIATVEGPASKRGVMYEVASGHQIPNEGEKKFQALTEEGREKQMTLQVCDVTQGLLSVTKMVAAGNKVVFDNEGSYVENKMSGDRTWLREKNGMFIMKLWVRRPF